MRARGMILFLFFIVTVTMWSQNAFEDRAFTDDTSKSQSESDLRTGEREAGEMVFDIFELEAGPADGNWMFDSDGTPFVLDGDETSNYAYSAFSWNDDGHGNGTCISGGSGVITDQECVSENLPFVDDPAGLGIYINGFNLNFFEHINTENIENPWNTMGEAGDHRIYNGGTGEITINGEVVLSVTDVIYDMTVYYPEPIGNGGATGYGTVEGEGLIDAENSDPEWVEYFDQDGSGVIYFYCGSMSPVLQMCYGTYDVDDLVVYGSEELPEIGWGNLQWPLHTVTQVGVATENIYGQVWIDGLTSEAGATPGLSAQVGYGIPESDPAGWNWTNSAFNADAGNNDEYVGQLTVDEAGNYEYTYRYSYNEGEWYYAEERGTLTVNAVQEFAEVAFNVNMNWQELAGNFYPQEDFVDIGGNFNNWNGSGAMTDMGDGWYQYTIELEVGYTCEYKYRLNGSWDTAELSDEGNRNLEVISGGVTIDDIYDNWEPEISFGELYNPFEIIVDSGEETPMIYGQIYIGGLTEGDAVAPLVEAQVGYGTGDQETWNWYDAEFYQNVNNNDEYAGTLIVVEPGNYSFSYRFRFNNEDWYYANSLGNMTVNAVEIPDLIINEINAVSDESSIGPDEDYEFVELYNPGNAAVDLSNYVLAGEVVYYFEEGTMIEADNYLVIARNPGLLSNVYGINNVVGPFNGELSDATGSVFLQNNNVRPVLVDNVDYDTSWYMAAEYGWSSLELRNPELDNNLEESWCSTCGSLWDESLYHEGGTPGVINLHECSIYDIQYPGDMHSEKVDEMVECTGIITAKFFGSSVQRYVIQVPEFLMDTYEYSGVFVYANDWLDFEQGDIITVTGLVTEDGVGYSETVLDPWNIELQSSGNELPEPVYIDMLDADERTDDWEGVLITTSGNCSLYNSNAGHWFLTDGLWSCTVGGVSDQHYSVPEGAITESNDYTVRGIIEGFEIWMRSEDDWNEGLYTLPGYISGTVTSALTGLGIMGAEITADYPEWRTEFTATTDTDGNYEMEVPVGTYHVTCMATGYEEPDYEIAIVNEGENEVIDFELAMGNQPPVIELPEQFVFDEDTTLQIDLNDYASDPENDPLTVTVVNSYFVDVDINGMILTFSTDENWNGSEFLIIRVYDSESDVTVSDDVTVLVNPVNDVPWIDLPTELVINLAIDPVPYFFDISDYYGDVDGDELTISVNDPNNLTVVINGNILEITPDEGFTAIDMLSVTVADQELENIDTMSVNVIDEAGQAEVVFDIFGLEAGPADANWMFDSDATPFLQNGDENSNYAYSAFNWNADGHGNGTCISGGSGVITQQIGVSESLPFVDDPEELSVYINDFDLTLFEHINTENAENPWNTLGEAGDHRQYSGGIGEISYNGEVVLSVTDVIYDMTVFYPAPVGNGGVTGYGTLEGEGVIDIENSDPQWVEYFDPNGFGLVYFYCGSMSPVLQQCYGTYDVDDLVIYGLEEENHPPVFYLPAQLAFNEDTTMELDVMDYAIDVDNDPLTVTVTGNEHLNYMIDGTIITFSAEANWFGSETVSITVDDNRSRATATDEVEIVVNPVNDVPVIELPDIFTFDENDSLMVDLSGYVSDVDNDNLTLSVIGNNNVLIDIQDLSVTFTAIEHWSGSETVTFIVDDGVSRLTAQDEVEVIVIPVVEYGDVDDNGVVESYDVSLILQYIVLLDPIPEDPIPWEEWRFLRADVDLNGVIGSYDAALILRYIVGMIDELPVRRTGIPEDNRLSISSDDNYLYLTGTADIYSLSYHILGSEYLQLDSPEVMQDGCISCVNGDRFALASATAQVGRIVRIPYERINSESCSILLEVECNGNYYNMSYDLPGSVPEVTQFKAVYPNPFNPETTISFQVAEGQTASLSIFNICGQVIYSETYSNGEHNFVWNADKFSSGIYFYRLQSDNYFHTGKMTLIK